MESLDKKIRRQEQILIDIERYRPQIEKELKEMYRNVAEFKLKNSENRGEFERFFREDVGYDIEDVAGGNDTELLKTLSDFGLSLEDMDEDVIETWLRSKNIEEVIEIYALLNSKKELKMKFVS